MAKMKKSTEGVEGAEERVDASEGASIQGIPILTKEQAEARALTGKGLIKDSAIPSANSKAHEQAVRERARVEEVAARASETMGAINPNAILPNPEILRKLSQGGSFRVVNAQKGYHYCLARTRPTTKDLQAKTDLGFQIVKDMDPENREHAESYDPVTGVAIGRRVIGDCILMRVPLAVWHEILKADQYRRWRQQVQVGVSEKGEIESLGAFWHELSERDQQRFLKRRFARSAARRKLHEQVMAGIVPGLPPDEAVLAAEGRLAIQGRHKTLTGM